MLLDGTQLSDLNGGSVQLVQSAECGFAMLTNLLKLVESKSTTYPRHHVPTVLINYVRFPPILVRNVALSKVPILESKEVKLFKASRVLVSEVRESTIFPLPKGMHTES